MRDEASTLTPPGSLVGARICDEAAPGGPCLEILEEIGHGRFSVVHEARGGDRLYAVKVLRAVAEDPRAARLAFRREAAVLASVDHPGLPRVHALGTVDGRPYLVMDLVRGRRLTQLVADGPLPEEQVIRIALELTQILDAAHRAGLVHRDVKPDNVVVCEDGAVRLVDFGLAARSGTDDAAVGTLVYCAPEQAGTWNRPVDGRADLYSLGTVLYECLAGVPPFRSTNAAELLRLHARGEVPDLSRLRPDLSPALVDVVTRLLAKDPDDRYPGCPELAVDLRAVVTQNGAWTGDDLATAGPRSPVAVVGRATELAALRAAWERARSGTGSVAVVTGPPGSGKSHLARALAQEAETSGALVLGGKSETDDVAPLSALRAAVDAGVRWLTGLAPDRRRRVIEDLVDTLGPAVGLLPILVPALADVLERPVRTSEADQQQQFPAAVAGLLTVLARASGAMLLHLDDVQWLDDGSVRVLDALVGELSEVPVLVLLAARDDEASRRRTAVVREIVGNVVGAELSLRELSPAEVADLVATRCGGMRLDERSAEALAVSAAGNPFTVLQYLGVILDAGLLVPSWGTWIVEADALQGLDLPLDAEALVLTRLDDLDAAGLQLLSVGAVLGARFDLGFLARVGGFTEDRARTVVSTAVHRGVLWREPEGGYRFVHDRIRGALLARLSSERVRAVHDVAAELLDAPASSGTDAAAERQRIYALAAHCRAGSPQRSAERVHRACARAGALALAEHLPSVALDLLTCAREAAERAGSTPDAAFLSSLGVAQHRAGRFREAVDTLWAAHRTARPGLERARVLDCLARVHDSTWNTDKQVEAVDLALRELGAALPGGRLRTVLSTAWMTVGGLLLPLVRVGYGTARGRHRDRHRLLTELYEAGALAHTRNLRPLRGMVLLLRSLWTAHRVGPSAQTARIRASMAHMLFVVGLVRTARRLTAHARRMGREQQDPQLDAYLAWLEAFDWYSFGLDQGSLMRRTWSEQHRWLDAGAANDLHLVLCWDALVRGELRSAETVFERRRVLVSGSDQSGRTADHPKDAVLLAMQGRVAESMAHLSTMRERAELRWEWMDILLSSLMVAVELDELGRFLDDVADELDRIGITPLSLVPSQRALYVYLAYARLEQCRTAEPDTRPLRLDQARRAVRMLRSAANTPLFRAHAAVIEAHLHWVEGRPAAALDALDGSARILRGVDAPLVAHEVAKVRARACRSLELRGEAERSARTALAVAVEEGWILRQRRIAVEFELERALSIRESSTQTIEGVQAEVYRRRLAAVEQVSLAASHVVEPDVLVRIALDEIIRVLGAERAFLFLVEGDPPRLDPRGGRDADGTDLPVLTGYTRTLVDRVLDTGEAQVFAGTEHGLVETTQSVAGHGLRSVLVAPMELSGRMVGVVYLDSRVARGIFGGPDVGLLTTIAKYIAIALENVTTSQLHAEVAAANRERDVADALRRALAETSRELDPQGVLRRVLTSLRTILDADTARMLPAPDDVGGEGFDPATAALLAAAEAVTGVAGEGEPRCVQEVPGTASWMAVPMTTRDATVGLAVLTSRRTGAFAGQAELATALVTQGMVAYENACLFSAVRTMATTDELTGLAARRHVLERAEERLVAAHRASAPLTVMMIDIDHFKRVNDTHGHRVGDQVLAAVARRLAAVLDEADLIGRYGGEEFVVLSAGAEVGLGERIRRAVSDDPVATSAGPLTVGVSVGLAILRRDDDLVGVLERADQHLYRAKREGRNRVCADPERWPEH